LRNEDYAPFLDAGTVRFYLSGTSTLGARGELTIRGLLARGELTEEQRRGLARRNVSGLPGYPEYGSLEDWRDGLFALEALGFRDLARERASDVATVLDAHWTGNAGDRPFAAAFDYAPYPEEPDDSPSCIAPTADAVALMVEFGAPPEIDLERLAFYLTSVARESRTHRRAQRVLAGLALAEFEERFDPGVLHRLRGRPLLWIASVCAAAVAVLAVLRARPLEGGEEVHGGGDEPVQEHAGPDAVRA
jgi:hypothetical protein